MHYLYVHRLDVQTHGASDFKGIVVLNHKLATVVSLDEHLIMHSLEGAALHFRGELRRLGIVHYIDILRAYDHIHRHVLPEAFVHAVELVAYEAYAAVAQH